MPTFVHTLSPFSTMTSQLFFSLPLTPSVLKQPRLYHRELLPTQYLCFPPLTIQRPCKSKTSVAIIQVPGVYLAFLSPRCLQVLRAHRGGKCFCTFNLLWQHGPLDKKKTVASIDGICLIQSRGSQVDPVLDSFLDLARSKVEARNTEVGNFPESLRQGIESMRCDIGGSNTKTKVTTCTGGNTGSLGHKSLEFQSSACRFEEMTPTIGVKRTFGKKHYSRTVQDMDLGTSIKRKADTPECFFFFRVSNLEKDITAVCIMDFIFEQTTISSVAFVIPSSSPESFSTGTIFVETKEKSEKLSKFLLNPGHLIMSLRGRPWVLNAKWNGSVEGRMPKYEWQSAKGKKGEHIGKLKLVTPEVKEYVMALELQKLHMEFLDYTEGLHDTLEREMKKIASRFPPPRST